MQLGEGDQIGHPRHLAVVLDDLADDPRGGQARHAADVHGGLSMAGADQNPAVARHQGEDVAGRDDVVHALRGVGGHMNGARPVGRRNPRGHALLGLNRNGEGGLHALTIVGRHRRQPQLIGPLGRQGQAHQPAGLADHEIDLVGGRELGGDDDVPLVLAVLGVHQDVGTAVAGVLKNVLDGTDRAVVHVCGQLHHAVSCHRARYRASMSISRLTGSPAFRRPRVVTSHVCGMIFNENTCPATLFTVRDTPSTVIEPLAAI